MGILLSGMVKPVLNRDTEGHRNYTVKFKVRGVSGEGPLSILTQTPGLPTPGQFWNFGSDVDPWAWCLPESTAEPFFDEEETWWWVTCNFSTKPPERNARRCNDTQIEDPILEPPKIDINARNRREEQTIDRFGRLLKNSAHEQIRGPRVEFDVSDLTVKIVQNVLTYNVAFNRSFMNKVNDSVLWGCPPRTIRVVNVDAQEKYFGLCYRYYTRTVELEFREDGFDRDLMDEGTKALNGSWNNTTREWTLKNINGEPPDKKNPLHFIRLLDAKGHPVKMPLDGNGVPYTPRLTDKCTDCIDVTAPLQLRVFNLNNFASGGLNIDPEVVLDEVILEHSGVVGNCEWEGIVPTDNVGGFSPIVFNNAGGDWSITTGAFGGIIDSQWRVDSWNCTDSLVLTKTAGNGPRTLYLQDANQPGLNRVEFYNEANLLLLGLPAFIGTL